MGNPYVWVVCCIIGVSLVLHFHVSLWVLLPLISSYVLLFVCLYPNKQVGVAFAILIVVMLRAHVLLSSIDTRLDALVTTEVVLTGVVVSEPDIRSGSSYYVIAVDGYDARIRVSLGLYPVLQYGEYVELKGALLFPENITNEQGLTFNYVGFLAKDGIRYVMRRPQILSHEPGGGNRIFYAIFKLKEVFVQTLNHALLQPYGALGAGILLGTKQALGESLLDAFRRSGLIHIVVLSGFNVTIIAEAIKRFFRRVTPSVGTICTVVSICVFAIMTGASATTIRASIMAIIATIAARAARTYNVHRALAVAAVLMIFHNPLLPFYDPGFQLSFVATLGLLFGVPVVTRWFRWIPVAGGLQETVVTTVATQLSVLPLLARMTGEVSIISLAANILVLPVVPVAMGFSAVLMLVGSLGAWVLPITLSTKALLAWIILITEYCARVPFAVLKIPT